MKLEKAIRTHRKLYTSAPELKKTAPDVGDSPTENERVYRTRVRGSTLALKKAAPDIGDSPTENERVFGKRVRGSAPELKNS